MRASRSVLGATIFSTALASCLPNDTRVPPASVLVTAESDGVATSGIPASATLDGWSITFDRVLVGLGNVNLDGHDCNSYSDARYSRIFDLKTPGKQKVSILYALGQCDVSFRVSSPNLDTLLAEGVGEADKSMMRTPASDVFTQEAGAGIYVRGRAVLGDETKTFEWSFRFRARYDRCAAGAVRGVDLRTKEAGTMNLELRPAVLFADGVDVDHARLRFQVFADADTEFGDGDGAITLDELARVPASRGGFGAAPLDGGSGVPVLDASYVNSLTSSGSGSGKDGSVEPSLADYLYLVLFPAIVRYQGDGHCSVELADRGLGS